MRTRTEISRWSACCSRRADPMRSSRKSGEARPGPPGARPHSRGRRSVPKPSCREARRLPLQRLAHHAPVQRKRAVDHHEIPRTSGEEPVRGLHEADRICEQSPRPAVERPSFAEVIRAVTFTRLGPVEIAGEEDARAALDERGWKKSVVRSTNPSFEWSSIVTRFLALANRRPRGSAPRSRRGDLPPASCIPTPRRRKAGATTSPVKYQPAGATLAGDPGGGRSG